jgi:hypothetical protein
MRTEGRDSYRPACEAIAPNDCTQCSLAYDCQRLRHGRGWVWPAVGLVLLSAMSLVGSLV